MSLKDYLLSEVLVPAILTIALLFSILDCSSMSGDHAREMPKFANDPINKGVELEDPKPPKKEKQDIQVMQQALDHFNEDLDIIIEDMEKKETEK